MLFNGIMKKVSFLAAAGLAIILSAGTAESSMLVKLYSGNNVIDFRITLNRDECDRTFRLVNNATGEVVSYHEFGCYEGLNGKTWHESFLETSQNYSYQLERENYDADGIPSWVKESGATGDMSTPNGKIYVAFSRLRELKNGTFRMLNTPIEVIPPGWDGGSTSLTSFTVEKATVIGGFILGKNVKLSAKDSTFDGDNASGTMKLGYQEEPEYGVYNITGCTFKNGAAISLDSRCQNAVIENNLFVATSSVISVKGANHLIRNNSVADGASLDIALDANNTTVSEHNSANFTMVIGGSAATSDCVIEKNVGEIRFGSYSIARYKFRNNRFAGIGVGDVPLSGYGFEIVENQLGCLSFRNAPNLIVRNNTFDYIPGSRCSFAIELIGNIGDNESESTIIEGNMIRGYDKGIIISSYKGNLTVKKNTIAEGRVGIDMTDAGCKSIHFENNSLRGKGIGGYNGGVGLIVSGSENIVAFNLVNGFTAGIEISGNNNGFHENIIENNKEVGLLVYGDYNWVYNNIIRDNVKNAEDSGTDNIWNKPKTAVNSNIIGGSYLGGNKWGDYSGTDTDKDGLGDTPYLVYEETDPHNSNYGLKYYDNLPLVEKSGYSPQNISVSPSSLTFGSICAGGTSDIQNLTVSNTGGTALAVESVSLIGADAYQYSLVSDGCSGKTLTSSQSCTISVVFSPKKEGEIKSFLRIISNDADNNIADISLTGVATPLLNLPGDLNGDCIVDLKDEILSLQINSAINKNVLLTGEVNGDGKIGPEESVFILQKVAEIR